MKYIPLACLFFLLCSCATTASTSPSTPPPLAVFTQTKNPGQPNSKVKEKKLGTIAVAKIAIDHPLAKRVFSTQIIQDSLALELIQSDRVDVIDWSRFKEVLFRRNLEWSDLVENAEGRKQIKEVLFNDYFLTGSVFSYSEHMDYASSAFSKSKSQNVEVKVNFFIKDALSNEILVSAQGFGRATKKISQTLGFGAAGGSDPALAHEALNKAIVQGVERLLVGLAVLKTPE